VTAERCTVCTSFAKDGICRTCSEPCDACECVEFYRDPQRKPAEAPKAATPPKADDGVSEHKKASQADELLKLADAGGYWFGTSTRGEPFGVPIGDSIARPLRGGRGSVRAELARAFAEKHGKAPSANALADTMLALEGKAYAGEERELNLRVAGPFAGHGRFCRQYSGQRGQVLTAKASTMSTVLRQSMRNCWRIILTASGPHPHYPEGMHIIANLTEGCAES
jgi:hypothetical protein